MFQLDPTTLKDSRITEVIEESDSRLLLHLRDGRAVAITAHVSFPHGDGGGYAEAEIFLDYELVNP